MASSCSLQLSTQSCAEAGLGKSRGAGFRVLTPSQPPGFLFDDAKELGVNEAWEEVRKSMEDADNPVSRVTLPLPVVAATGWEGLTGRFGKGQWSGLPCAVLLTNTGYPGWAGKVHAGCTSDLDSTWEFQRILRASTLHCFNSQSMCPYGSHTRSPVPPHSAGRNLACPLTRHSSSTLTIFWMWNNQRSACWPLSGTCKTDLNSKGFAT